MHASATYDERRGELPDGTAYLVRVPANWNQVLMRDLDFAVRAFSPEREGWYLDMLARGFAVAGTARHRLRAWQYDPAREIDNLERVADLVQREFAAPGRIVQFGCSGGGHVGLAMSESFFDRLDGTVAMGTHTPVWLMNSFLDGWFVMHTLLAPHHVDSGGDADDLSTGFPNDGSSDPSGHGMHGRVPKAWRYAIRAAQASPTGRARLVLAFAIGQWSPWLGLDAEEPDFADPNSLQESIFVSALQLSRSPGGEARVMFENAAQGQQLSWNDDVDYATFLHNAAPGLRWAVDELYERADTTLEQDLAMIDESPRIAASEHAMEFWKQPGRNVWADPKVPVFRMHMVGDYQVPYSLAQGYERAVEVNDGAAELARFAYVKRSGHCNFTTAETSTAIDVLMNRIETGEWPDTTPSALNVRGENLETGTTSAFTEIGPYRIARFNRSWLPE